MTEIEYLQNDLNRLFQRRGDLATMRDDIENEDKQVTASIALTRSRIAALAAQPQMPAMPVAPPSGAPAEAPPRLRAVLAEEAAKAAPSEKP